MQIIQHPDVIEELINLSYRIALDDMEAANRFLDACEETFQRIANMPFIGVQRTFNNPALEEVRMWHIKGFDKHLVFYRPLDDGIEILHVVHGARDLPSLFGDE